MGNEQLRYPATLSLHTWLLIDHLLIPVMPYLLTYSNTLRWLEAHLLTCPSRKYLHLECPGCGFQRSVLALFRGDIPGSKALYPATIPIFMIAIVTALHLRYHFRHGAATIKYLQFAIAIVITVNYIYKVIHLNIFV
jgi:hypothetical protein